MTVTPEFPQDDDDETRRREAAGMPKDISDMSAAERKIFDGLAARGWEIPPQPRDFINPEIRRMFKLGDDCARELNEFDEADGVYVGVLNELEKQWDATGLRGAMMIVTGKVRPLIENDSVELANTLLDPDEAEALFGMLPVEKYDVDGIYYQVRDIQMQIGAVSVVEMPIYVSGKYIGKCYVAMLGLRLGDRAIFTVCSKDLEYITLSPDSENGQEVFLREHLPEVFAQIDQSIPNDPQDLGIIFDALEGFALTVDKAKVEAYMTWDDFQDFIGEYLGQRINLGTVEYILDVEGLVSTRTMDHKAVLFTHEEPHEYRVKIGKIFPDITPGIDSDATTVTCRLVLETFHRSPNWNGGYVPYFIPAGSVLGCRSTRPARLPFVADESVVYGDEQMEDHEKVIHPVDGVVFDSFEQSTHDDKVQTEVDTVDTIAPPDFEEGMATIAEIAGMHNRGEYLEAMEKQLSDLWEKVCQLSAVEYETQKGGIVAIERVKKLILKFHTAYYGNEFELCARGSGVMLPNISTSYSRDQETVKVELTMHGQTTFEPGSITTETRGFLEDGMSLDVVEMPDNRFMIRVQLTLAGLVDEPLPTIYNAEDNQPLVELSQKRYYNVEIRPDTAISIVELDLRRDQEAAIAELVALFPERSDIPPAMGVLMYELSADKEDEYEAIESTPNINELAELAVEYPEHADTICSALQKLFGLRHKLIMNGPVIYHDGEEGEDVVRGELVGIVPEYRYKLTTKQEPFAVLLLAKTATQTHDKLVYVPLQSVRIIEA